MDFAESWVQAENTVFAGLLKRLGGQENVTAWKGAAPYRDGVWMLTSGGSSTGSDADRLCATGADYSHMNLTASVSGIYALREDAMRFAMKVMNAIDQETNFRDQGNVKWFHAVTMPSEPQLIEDDGGGMMWLADIPCQMVFATA
jgi:hypothetical protein